jgi:hypothetical protein
MKEDTKKEEAKKKVIYADSYNTCFFSKEIKLEK